MMERKRAALVGTGGIAHTHAGALQDLYDRVELVAVMDIDPVSAESFRSRYAIPRAYVDLASLLDAERPDLVHICTPPDTHCDQIVLCLEAGAWVLCEKPLCASLAEMGRIDAAEERTGRYCGTVFQWRFGSAALHLKRLIASEELGRPLLSVCQTVWYRSQEYYQVPWRASWTGGTTLNHGIHAIDLLLWLLPEWREVQAITSTLDRVTQAETVSLAHIRFADGSLASIANSAVSPRQETTLRLDFQRATVSMRGLYRYGNADWSYSIPEGAPWQAELARWQAIGEDVPPSHEAQIRAFLDSMDDNTRPLVSGLEARRIVEFLTCLYKSASTAIPTHRGSIGAGDRFYHSLVGVPDR
jgi:predicted dehydrogenase